MRNLNKAKEVYNSIKVPEKLNYTINKAVLKEKQKKVHTYKGIRYTITTVACAFSTFVFLLNINPSFAASVSEVPIIGSVAKVFTIKEYKREDETKLINAKIPALENTGNSELEERINYEIMLKINEILDEAEQRAAEYKEAVIATGGSEEDYHPINIQIDYKVGYSGEDIVSFVINKSETLASVYTEMFFYNIDMQSGKKLNLRDVLGEDYKEIVDKSIYKQMEERSQNPDNVYFSEEEGGFDGIENEYQDFYINSDGKVVIVFKKYEIAPGYMGIQEFEIDQ